MHVIERHEVAGSTHEIRSGTTNMKKRRLYPVERVGVGQCYQGPIRKSISSLPTKYCDDLLCSHLPDTSLLNLALWKLSMSASAVVHR